MTCPYYVCVRVLAGQLIPLPNSLRKFYCVLASVDVEETRFDS